MLAFDGFLQIRMQGLTERIRVSGFGGLVKSNAFQCKPYPYEAHNQNFKWMA